MPSEIETFRMSAMNRYLQEQARDAISRAQHTTRKENVDLEPGTWFMYFRRGKVTRGAIGAPSASGLWLGPARVITTEAVQQWSGSVHSTTGQIGVVLGVARKQADQMSFLLSSVDAVKERYRLPL